MFSGDIARFAPADLVAFLGHMRKEGVLTVGGDDDSITVEFHDGRVVAASSAHADARALAILRAQGVFDDDAVAYFAEARSETGLPLRRLLEDAGAAPEIVAKATRAARRDALLELLLRERGRFQFAELDVAVVAASDDDTGDPLFDAAREADEYRERMRSLGGDARVVVAATPQPRDDDDAVTRALVTSARTPISLAQLVAAAPCARVDALEAVRTLVARGRPRDAGARVTAPPVR